ncbi:MAG: endolytic transglycosylase MltG [Candidatus Saccharibacteria bacterium]
MRPTEEITKSENEDPKLVSDQKEEVVPIKPIKNSHTLKIFFILFGLLILMVISALGWFFIQLTSVRDNVSVNGELIIIDQGNGISSIADKLKQKSLISDKNVFIIYAKFGPAHGKLQPGPYLIKPTSSILQIVSDMSSGKIAVNKITFPEGITIKEMAKRWANSGYGTQEEFIASARRISNDYPFVPSISKDNPEGYLFPATYTFNAGGSVDTVIKKQFEAFNLYALPLLQGNRPAGLSQNQVLALASIVEKEALTDVDRKMVAGVFINRINLGMKLESDVTVNYATGKTQTSAFDISVVSPYNTYSVVGLPPTPINNPGTSSISAVMNYTKSDNIFFLAGNDGVIYYATNLQKHNENIKNHL